MSEVLARRNPGRCTACWQRMTPVPGENHDRHPSCDSGDDATQVRVLYSRWRRHLFGRELKDPR